MPLKIRMKNATAKGFLAITVIGLCFRSTKIVWRATHTQVISGKGPNSTKNDLLKAINLQMIE